MFNISSLAAFLSIDVNIIEDFKVINRNDDVLIYITTKKKSNVCPSCHSSKIELKEYKIRHINHDLFYAKTTTFIHRYRRFKCLSCLKTFSETSDFAPRKAKESYETIRLVMKYAKSYTRTWRDIASLTHISDTTAINIFDRYMNPPRRKLSLVLSMDECYNEGSFLHPYSCNLFDFLANKVIDIIDGREKNTLLHYFSKIPKEEKNIVRYVVIDMWEPYLDVATLLFPHAVVAVDSFHVMQNIVRALNDVRKRVMNRYETGTPEYYLLKHWHSTLFQNLDPGEEKMKNKGYKNKWLTRYEIREIILSLDTELKMAQRFYSLYRYHNEHSTKEEFTKKIEIFINDREIIKVREFVSIIEMLSTWKPYILNSFIVVNGRRLSNGPIEGFNSKFKSLLESSNNLFTHQRFRNRLMYTYNNIETYTRTSDVIHKPKRKKRGPYKKRQSSLE